MKEEFCKIIEFSVLLDITLSWVSSLTLPLAVIVRKNDLTTQDPYWSVEKNARPHKTGVK